MDPRDFNSEILLAGFLINVPALNKGGASNGSGGLIPSADEIAKIPKHATNNSAMYLSSDFSFGVKFFGGADEVVVSESDEERVIKLCARDFRDFGKKFRDDVRFNPD
mmetsp:Transcript_2922/g.5128  ORF Transcript_2922/g.5128 Transcript_2922/m.5128 type:complete len:108 (-) Transcript_2922:107-430(-)